MSPQRQQEAALAHLIAIRMGRLAMKCVRWMSATAAILGAACWSSAREDTVVPKAGAKFDEVVKMEFPKDGYPFTLAEAAKGIKISYKITIAQDYPGVIALRSPPSFREPAGPSGLHPREEIPGNGQLYCLMDFGLAA